MGFLDNQSTLEISGDSGVLNLVEFEKKFVRKFNDLEILNTKYKAEEFGITYDKGNKRSDVYSFDGDEVITICPEPLEFIKEFDDVSDNSHAANELFAKKIQGFQKIALEKKALLRAGDTYGDRMWMNKTLTGINLRPGNLNDDREDFTPVRMCDDNVHGLIAGRTGSGKSVFINALILSLITEYAPWELNLYLADFKKVELSRYMNDADSKNDMTAFTPHINACAATSEIRYVISLIQYLVDCMKARQEFFARIGVTKIQEFRNKYGLVLPRVLLIVDEFQQLFTEATSREREEIQTMLNSITKLGRATGFHLIFASQEMSGTLRGNTLANFKIRMALPCNQQISMDILGNGQAVNLERGYVLVNMDSGDELKNKKYRVPFIETDKKDDDDGDEKMPFYGYLDEIKLESKKFDLSYKTEKQKFYREELQETENDYRRDLERIRERKNELVSRNKGLFDGIILGKSVMYSPLPNDKVSFYIEKGRNKAVMIAAPNPEDAARIRKLLAENLFRSDRKTYHFGIELNNLILERYRMEEAVKAYPSQIYCRCETDKALEYLQMVYFLRKSASKYLSQQRQEYSRVCQLEEHLVCLLADSEQVREYREFRKERERLERQIAQISECLQEASALSKKKLVNPVVTYLEKCSGEITVLSDGTKADLIKLRVYGEIAGIFSLILDTAAALEKSLGILDKKIGELETKKEEQKIAVVRHKIFRRALLYYKDRYEGREPEKKTSVTDTLEKCYLQVETSVNTFKKEYAAKKSAQKENAKGLEKGKELQEALDRILSEPNEILRTEEALKGYIGAFIRHIFEETYGNMGYKRNRPPIPEADYDFSQGKLTWTLWGENISEPVQLCGNDILQVYEAVCQGAGFSGSSFAKGVFWINGLDELEKIPSQIVEIIRNAINQNILMVSMITSELKDTTIRKAFDYAFVTGNIEKFYSMFQIKYTKQPLDSIVVNFGIRSKGFDIPFKMYKSNLEDIQAPNFIDQLLNG